MTVHAENPSPEELYREAAGTASEAARGLSQVQECVDTWIDRVGVAYFPPITNVAILTEEVGEVARIMVRMAGGQSLKPGDKSGEFSVRALGDELADVLWVVAALANQMGVNLQEAFMETVKKKYIRDATRHANNPVLQQLRENSHNTK